MSLLHRSILGPFWLKGQQPLGGSSSPGDVRVQEGAPNCARMSQALACVTAANILLVKASNTTEPNGEGGGSTLFPLGVGQ